MHGETVEFLGYCICYKHVFRNK